MPKTSALTRLIDATGTHVLFAKHLSKPSLAIEELRLGVYFQCAKPINVNNI